MLANPFTLLARLPATVRVLILGTLVNKLGAFIFPFLTLVLNREFHLPATHVAALLMAYGVGSLISIMVGGVLTDSLGRRRILLTSLFGSGLLAVALGFAPSEKVFVPLLVAFAFLTDLYRPASSALVSDLLPSSERSLGYAALRMAVNLGFFVGMGLGGVLVDWNWRFMFVADGVTTLLCGALVFFRIPETRPQPVPAEAAIELPAGRSAAPTSPWRDRPFLALCLASFVFAFSFFADFTVFPLTITNAGYPALVFGLIVGMNGLLIAVFEVTATAWLRRYRRLRVAALGALVSGIGFGLIGMGQHWAWFTIVAVLWTAGEILALPQQMAFAADWAPPLARGRYLSVYTATWALASAVSPVVLLPLHARLGERLFWPLLFLANLPGAAILWRLDRTADRPERLRGHSEKA